MLPSLQKLFYDSLRGGHFKNFKESGGSETPSYGKGVCGARIRGIATDMSRVAVALDSDHQTIKAETENCKIVPNSKI